MRFHKPSPEEYFHWWWKAVRKLLSSRRKNIRINWINLIHPCTWPGKKKTSLIIPSKSPRHNWSCRCRGSLGGKGLWQLIKGTIAVETCFHLKQLSFLGWQFFWWKKNNLLISKPTNICQLPAFWKRPMLCYVNWENWWNHKDLYTLHHHSLWIPVSNLQIPPRGGKSLLAIHLTNKKSPSFQVVFFGHLAPAHHPMMTGKPAKKSRAGSAL